MTPDLTQPLLNWYAQHARCLPWRTHPDPYVVWVSEIMLQQTRVETVIPFFQRWMKHFPSLTALASASQQEVLAVWEGLGYYSRARNLHRAAQLVVEDYEGELPRDPLSLRKLPGIGRYTAGAILSIAFGMDEPALDGNARRVLARYFNVTEPARSTRGEHILWALAKENLPAGQAGEYNQALMDLGAEICTPREPNCEICPLARTCQAYTLGVQKDLPVALEKAATPHITVTAAVIYRDDRVLITRRPQNGLLGGMWEFPGGKMQSGEDLVSCLQREIKEELAVDVNVAEQLGVYRHAYTHFRVTLHAFRCSLVNGYEPELVQVDDLRWTKLEELADFPMGKIDRQISNQLREECI